MKVIFQKLTVGAVLASMIFGMTSCATIFTGSSDMVTFKSNVPETDVQVNGLSVGKTECTVKLKRSISKDGVVLKKEGYKDYTVPLDKSFNAVTLVNLLFWPGFIVDLITGATSKIDMRSYDIEMKKKASE